ncbi:hypothetical protein MF672_043895 [Actinomadura sp. ATCC 31491]|uniref:Uncharacterized protein n=1 Tax=Actinomadura luzonensis TaxID=2805427 RepID=A0ABT0G7Y8_9ACTN|nr:hypothetical protein [Actinomadura luzonensis]MCK2220701.1 hypothetical protein [Actinomadura luzonensis]
MRTVLTLLGWLLLLQGTAGLGNTLLGLWPWTERLLVVHHVGFLDGYEVFAAIVIGVLGFVLLALAETVGKTEGRR